MKRTFLEKILIVFPFMKHKWLCKHNIHDWQVKEQVINHFEYEENNTFKIVKNKPEYRAYKKCSVCGKKDYDVEFE